MQMHAILTQHYRAWLTMKISALGGKTPKQMSRTKDGQAQVAEMLKGVENSVRRLEHDSGVLRPLDLNWMWEELGIDRAAACLEKGERFDIQIAGERIYVPAHAVFNIEHERDADQEEIEFQITWKREA